MATTYHAAIQALYVAYFNRPADVDGLNYWEGVVEAAGGNTAAVSQAFSTSAEYTTAFQGMGYSAVVGQIYQNLFGHAADVPGLNYWSTNLSTGALTIANIVKNIADGAQGTDKTAFANKVLAATAFTNALDTSEEIIGYNGDKALMAAKNFISSITTDASLAAAIVPATLQNTINNVIVQANTGNTTWLTAQQDNATGTAGNDLYMARIFDNQNTLQSGDRIAAGAGSGDRLEADVGLSQKFAIAFETTGVEQVAIRAQSMSTDMPDNNMQTKEVQIDAERTVGVNHWENNNSRADLLIEDIRIMNHQITKDITIAMVETDPGHVDFGVYFDQYSLRAQTNSSNVLRLQLMDTRSAALGLAPLLENPYNGFAFFFKGILTTVSSPAIDAATTYDQLFLAIQAAVAATPGMSQVVVSKGAAFTAVDTTNGTVQTGTEIVLTSNNGDTINANGLGAGWVAAGAVPPNSGLHTNMSTLASQSVDLVTSKIILDDVGRGSTGGDLVVGGLSVGDTSGSQGVQRFEIEVRDNSKLQTINSTNNTLREVTVVNGLTTSSSHAYVTTTKDKGDLTVLGTVGDVGVVGVPSAASINEPLPGTYAQHNQYGFSDVRLIDASAMTGKFTFDAEITTAVIAKYINLKDFAANPSADNINFVYTGGANNDSMTVNIDGTVMASQSQLLVGLEDFTFTANGGAGNDEITVAMVNRAQPGNDQAWYNNQVINKNVTLNGGDGDDTIRTPGAGNKVINGDAGNDTIYADNTGMQGGSAVSPVGAGQLTLPANNATWVFNTANQLATGVGFYDLAVNEERNLADLKGDSQETYNLYNTRLTVTYRDLQSTVTVASTGYKTSDMQFNQALKDAINNNVILNKLIVATDGPENTIVVTAIIDGVHSQTNLVPPAMSVTDLGVSIAIPATGTLSGADIAGAAAAYGLPAGSNDVAVIGAMSTAAGVFNTNGDYVAQFAETGALGTVANAEIVGADSVTSSDNVITGGVGNDVIVLGTTLQPLVPTALGSSNEVVVYAGTFGNDVVVNFDAGVVVSADQLNFSALGGRGAQFAGGNTHQSITVAAEVAANDTIAEIAAFYTDDATASTHVYVAVEASNNAKIYTVVDGVGTGAVVVTLVGNIDLADTAWGNLVATNFV